MRAAGSIRGSGESGSSSDAGDLRALQITRMGSDTLAGLAPGNSSIAVSPFVAYSANGNLLQDNAVDGFGSSCPFPEWLDHTRPMVCRVWLDPTGPAVGDVNLTIGLTVARPGDLLDGTLAAVLESPVESVSNQTNELIVVEAEIDPPEMFDGDMIFLFVARIATAGNLDDTFAGDVEVVEVDLRGRVR